MHRAVGDQLTCVFVDHGLLREGEAEQVVETFGDHLEVPLVHVQAQERFLAPLAGVTDPETKRKIIGETFIRVFEDEAAQARRRPLPGAGHALLRRHRVGLAARRAKIKSHHNVGGLPEDMDFELVEPLRLLFKDEVRAVGEELGLPDEMVWRQPFPGPGLAIRIIGEVTAERLDDPAPRRRRRCRRRSGAPASTASSGRASRCCRRSSRSACMGDYRTYAYPIVHPRA